ADFLVPKRPRRKAHRKRQLPPKPRCRAVVLSRSDDPLSQRRGKKASQGRKVDGLELCLRKDPPLAEPFSLRPQPSKGYVSEIEAGQESVNRRSPLRGGQRLVPCAQRGAQERRLLIRELLDLVLAGL